MTEEYEVVRLEINKLNLGENDYLFLKFPDNVPLIEIEHLIFHLKKSFPKLANKIAVVIGSVELYVVHKEEK